MSEVRHFVVVDDDHVNNMICRVLLTSLYRDALVKTFLNPLEALEHLRQQPSGEGMPEIVWFLDINMPHLSAWEFLERFGSLDASVKKRNKLYILSSSINHQDIQRANASPYVARYLSKPLTKSMLEKVLSPHGV